MKEEILTYINNIPIRRNFVENLPYNPSLRQLSKEKRKAGILSEVLFWKQVRVKSFHNIDFDRQRIIGNYIVDFYVKTLGLIVEIDLSSHESKDKNTIFKQKKLESLGLEFFIIKDFDVKHNLNLVMKDLENFIIEKYGNHPVL
ncbi:Very-short-patch-repair endonuclease [Halpernia humi]|uniref:Very-short-patch-repair endonuclease n=1 Tax=Halpernia humi TaxID=493375 RepID=A0A1H6AHC6_9FLAO|nr:DUF559 domain-containing protein [Halpernia humi]SEG47792.1 Very-short-patch-repair endonuclease [Halpernia humi]